ncbi:MAG: HAD-IA family hydrolase [Firmicutes bacterium]|nr:HAD-IA family hydrolase [Bacillota bacterium]
MTALLFDLDGTIADSVPVIIETAIKTCKKFDVDITEKDIAELIGIPLLKQGEKFLGAERAQEYYDAYQDTFLHLQEDCIQPFEGMRELLASCKRLGAKVGIVTSKGQEGTAFSLKCLKIDEYIDAVVHAHSEAGHKPDAGPALKALEMMDEKAQNSMLIGDSVFDIRCGKNAGALTCAVLWGSGERDELLSEHPDYAAETVAELKNILTKYLFVQKSKEA